MAKVYSRVRGKKLEKVIAITEETQLALSEHAANAARRARADLTRHRYEGHSEILVEKGRVDRYVILSDERGLWHAMSIEYGRRPDEDGKGGMEGLFILHNAFHI